MRSGPPRLRLLFVAAMLTLSMGLLTCLPEYSAGAVWQRHRQRERLIRGVNPGATVTITNKETSLSPRRARPLGDDGGFSIINVLPGSYDLKVSLPGFP